MRGGTHGTLIDNGSDVKFSQIRMEGVKCKGQVIKARSTYVHNCTSQSCHLVGFGLCALAKRPPCSSLKLQQGCIGLCLEELKAFTIVHVRQCTFNAMGCLFIQLSRVYVWLLSYKMAVWTKTFFFSLILHVNDCFSFYHAIVNISSMLLQIRGMRQ